MTKKGRKRRFLRSFLPMFMNMNKISYLQTKILTKLTKKVRYLYVQNKKQKLKIMKKGGVKTSEDGEIINDCFLLNEYKRLFWREK